MTDQGDSFEEIDSGAAVLCGTRASVSLPTMVPSRPRCSAWSIEEKIGRSQVSTSHVRQSCTITLKHRTEIDCSPYGLEAW
jgi:hypothetical protein